MTTVAETTPDVVVVLESRTHRVVVRTGQRFDVVELASKTTLAAEMDEAAFRQRLPEVYDEYRRSMAMMDASL